MVTKIQAINFGNTIVESVLACRPESPLEQIKKETEKIKLKAYFELFRVSELNTELDVLIKSNTNNFFILLIELIQKIRRLITMLDQTNQNLSDFFFLSSLLNYIDITLESIKQGHNKDGLLNICYPFISTAIDISDNLAIKSPSIFRNKGNKDSIQKKDTDLLKLQMKIWFNNLNEKAKQNEDKKNKFFDNIWKILAGIITLIGGIWVLIQLLRYFKIMQ